EAAGPLEGLALTHLDAWPPLGRFRHATAYHCPERCVRLPAASGEEQQTRLTATLSRARAELAEGPPDPPAVIERIERLLERRIAITSHGPRASDVALREDVTRVADPSGSGSAPR